MAETRDQKLCLGLIALLGVYSLALLPLAPSQLQDNYLLLAALRGSTSAMIVSGAHADAGDISLVTALLAPLLTLFVRPPLFWWAGRLWGREAATMIAGQGPRAERWTRRVEGWGTRWENVGVVAAYILPVPSAVIFAGAGWLGMSLRRFLLLDLIGTSGWIALNVGLGYAIGNPVVKVAEGIARYGLILTIVLVVVVFAIGARRGRRLAPQGGPTPPS